jgi:hypothetical protein
MLAGGDVVGKSNLLVAVLSGLRWSGGCGWNLLSSEMILRLKMSSLSSNSSSSSSSPLPPASWWTLPAPLVTGGCRSGVPLRDLNLDKGVDTCRSLAGRAASGLASGTLVVVRLTLKLLDVSFVTRMPVWCTVRGVSKLVSSNIMSSSSASLSIACEGCDRDTLSLVSGAIVSSNSNDFSDAITHSGRYRMHTGCKMTRTRLDNKKKKKK